MTARPMTIGLNRKYLADALGMLESEEKVAITVNDPGTAVRIAGAGGDGENTGPTPGELHVLMPMRA